jgi:hypothetical protein
MCLTDKMCLWWSFLLLVMKSHISQLYVLIVRGKKVSIYFQKFPTLGQHNRCSGRTNRRSKKSQSQFFRRKKGNVSIMVRTRKSMFFPKVSGANPKKDILKMSILGKWGIFGCNFAVLTDEPGFIQYLFICYDIS